MKTEIIFEDNDIIVIYKPPGFATQTAKVGQADVVSELRNYFRIPNPYVGVVHRLDQPVEGLLVFGKNKKAAGILTAELAGRGDKAPLHKHYYAAVCGQIVNQTGELVDYLMRNGENKAEIVSTDEGKKAVLYYQILESVTLQSGETIHLADINIETGRFHQIRAQMSHAGMPLLGDIKYGDKESCELSSRLGVRSVALCAYRIEFLHPITKKPMGYQIIPKSRVFEYFHIL